MHERRARNLSQKWFTNLRARMYLHAFYTPVDYKYAMETQFAALTPYENFLYALKAKESKRQYPHSLKQISLAWLGLVRQ